MDKVLLKQNTYPQVGNLAFTEVFHSYGIRREESLKENVRENNHYIFICRLVPLSNRRNNEERRAITRVKWI